MALDGLGIVFKLPYMVDDYPTGVGVNVCLQEERITIMHAYPNRRYCPNLQEMWGECNNIRTDIARALRTARSCVRGSGDVFPEWRHGRAVVRVLTRSQQIALEHTHKPGSAREWQAAWHTVRWHENNEVQLSHLPCGTDDAAWEAAMHSYNTALAIVRERGRPLPG